jgi:hypothetical protein
MHDISYQVGISESNGIKDYESVAEKNNLGG